MIYKVLDTRPEVINPWPVFKYKSMIKEINLMFADLTYFYFHNASLIYGIPAEIRTQAFAVKMRDPNH